MLIFAAVLTLLLAVLFVYVVKKNAQALNLIDIPNARSEHTVHKPRGAGIGFVLSVLITLSIFFSHLFFSHTLLFLAIFFVFSIGVLDDRYDIAPNIHFFIIILATILVYFDGLMIDDVGNYFGTHLYMGWFAIPFTIFAVVGFTNALNLIDGLDGLASSISIIILTGLLIIGVVHHDEFMIVLSTLFISALVGFLFYNWNPASIFMGDSGSLTLGFVISLLSIKALDYIPTVSILFLAAIPIIDTIVAMIRRKRSGKSLFEADKLHIHHLLQNYFNRQTKKSVLTLSLLQLVYVIIAFQFDKEMDQTLPFILFLANVYLVYRFIKPLIPDEGKEKHN